ncbi:hypothetical protein SAMN05421539_12431 [Jannaschia seohaensis]|uniref:YD repeat-containing protein n=1 Tax=Jannaschia seohaensis TaxID=475081 RepID=A0A2Y9C3M8_9RHOB|nr:hypothetical protein BCF38_12431 [Jannaschia seohaensis]SSA51752.1 hypothetical protein SAMN05421539_12431 [Jannaschia seohaensis]
MSRIYHRTIRAAALVAALGAALPAAAQTIGDVGRDSSGNVYTFTRDAQGNGVWTRGRTMAGGTERTILAERYTPTIWVDPDGCEHWVMDDGAEGFMTPHLMPNGRPVCRGMMMMNPGD